MREDLISFGFALTQEELQDDRQVGCNPFFSMHGLENRCMRASMLASLAYRAITTFFT